MVASPAPTIVTVPLLSTVAILVCKLVKVTGRPDDALASRLKLAESTVLSGISAKVMVWSARGVAVTINVWVALLETQGVCPGWVAVMVTLPILRALTVYPVVASPEKDTTVESLLSKVKVVSPESALTLRVADCPTCLSRDWLEGDDLGSPKCRLGVFVSMGGDKSGDQAPLMGKVAFEFLAYPIAQPTVISHHFGNRSRQVVSHFFRKHLGLRNWCSIPCWRHPHGWSKHRGHLPDHHMIIWWWIYRNLWSQGKLLGGSGQVLVAPEWFGHRTLGRCLFEYGCNCTDIAIIGNIEALPAVKLITPLPFSPACSVSRLIRRGCLTCMVVVSGPVIPRSTDGQAIAQCRWSSVSSPSILFASSHRRMPGRESSCRLKYPTLKDWLHRGGRVVGIVSSLRCGDGCGACRADLNGAVIGEYFGHILIGACESNIQA